MEAFTATAIIAAVILAAVGCAAFIKSLMRDEYMRGFKAGYNKASYDAALIQTQISKN